MDPLNYGQQNIHILVPDGDENMEGLGNYLPLGLLGSDKSEDAHVAHVQTQPAQISASNLDCSHSEIQVSSSFAFTQEHGTITPSIEVVSNPHPLPSLPNLFDEIFIFPEGEDLSTFEFMPPSDIVPGGPLILSQIPCSSTGISAPTATTTIPDSDNIIEQEASNSPASSAVARDTPKPKKQPKARAGGRSSKGRKRNKEFLHQKNDPGNWRVVRAQKQRNYRAIRKQVNEEKDNEIKRLKSENQKLSEELARGKVSRSETIKICKHFAAIVNAVKYSSPGVDIVIHPSLGNLNSPKLSDQEIVDIAQNRLSNERFTLEFDRSDVGKGLQVFAKPTFP